MSACNVREAVTRDIDALAPLVIAFRDHLQLAEPDCDDIPASLSRLLGEPNTLLLVAVGHMEHLLGYASLRFRFSLWVSGLEAQLDDLFVVAAARKKGVGRQLVAASVEAARSRSAKVVGLNTNERNASALRLYTASGFRAERKRWGGGRQLWLELET